MVVLDLAFPKVSVWVQASWYFILDHCLVLQGQALHEDIAQGHCRRAAPVLVCLSRPLSSLRRLTVIFPKGPGRCSDGRALSLETYCKQKEKLGPILL